MYNKKFSLNLITLIKKVKFDKKVDVPQTYSDIVKVTVKILQLLFFIPIRSKFGSNIEYFELQKHSYGSVVKNFVNFSRKHLR